MPHNDEKAKVERLMTAEPVIRGNVESIRNYLITILIRSSVAPREQKEGK